MRKDTYKKNILRVSASTFLKRLFLILGICIITVAAQAQATATLSTGATAYLGGNNLLTSSVNIALNGATLSTNALSGTVGYSQTFGTLTLSTNSTINLGTGTHTLTFGSSGGVSWQAGIALTINGWQGTAGSSGTAGQIFVGTDATGLTATQVAQITFTGYGVATILPSGEIVPFAATTPTITATSTMTAFTSCTGSASSNKSFVVSGQAMSAGITITPPSGFEVSTTSDFSSNFGDNATPITVGSSGTISSTTIYVRIQSSASGTPSGNIVCSSTDATDVNVAVSGTVYSIPSAPTADNNGPVCAGASLTLSCSTLASAVYSWTGPNTYTSSSQNPTVSASATTAMSGTYSVTVTLNGCTSSPGTTAATVNPVISGNTSGSAVSICTGTSTTLTGGTVSGGSGSYTYLWESSSNNSTWATAAGTSDGANYTTASLSSNTYFRRTVTSGGCTSTATSVLVTVNPVISGNTSGSAVSICTSTSTTLTGGTVSGGSGSYTYLWESSSDNSNWATAAGTSNGANYTTATLTSSTYFRRTVTSGGCTNTATSILVTVNPVISGNTSGAAVSICTGTSTTLTGGTASGGNTSYTYLWESSSDNSSWSTAAGTSNAANYTTATLSANTYFRRTVTSGGCTSTATSILVTVNPVISGNSSGSSKSICSNTTTSLTGGTAGGGSGSYTYLWQSSSNNSTWATAAGTSNTANYTTASLSSATYFRRVVTSGGCSDTASSILVSINALPTVTVNSPTICANQTATLTASGASTYTWTGGLSAVSNPTTPALTTNTSYTVTGTDVNGCTATATATVTVSGTAPTAITISQSPTPVCAGSVATLTVSGGTVPNNAANYSFAASSGTFTPLSGGTGVSAVQADDGISAAIPIGFNFTYAGNTYSNAYVSSNGFISFNSGAAATPNNTPSTPSGLSAAASTNLPLIAPLWDDLSGATTGTASYTTTGTSGSKIFTFEWLNWKWNYQATGAVVSFQVKLYESNGKIEFYYRSDATAQNAGISLGASVGLAGTTAGNYLSLSSLGASPSSSTTSETSTILAKPASGQIFTFTPPPTVSITWSPTTNLYTNSSATTPYTGQDTRTVYAVNSTPTTYTATATAGSCSNTSSLTTNISTTSTPLGSAVIADNGTQVALNFTTRSTSNLVLHKSSLTVSTSLVKLTQFSCTTTGTYLAADVSNLKLWYQTAAQGAIFNSAVATNVATIASPGIAGVKTFSSFTQSLPVETGYFFITIDVAAAATIGNTISVSPLTTSNLTITSPCDQSITLSGSTTAGGLQTITSSSATTGTFNSIVPRSGCPGVTSTIYNISLTANADVTVGAIVTLTFATPFSSAITCTGGTFSGSAINIATLSTTTNSITFTAPVTATSGFLLPIVLTGLGNYPTAGTYSVTVQTLLLSSGASQIFATSPNNQFTIAEQPYTPTFASATLSRCGPGTVGTFTASSGGLTNFFWYTDNSTPPLDGSAVGPGGATAPSATYTPPSLSTTTNYYAQAISGWSPTVNFSNLPNRSTVTSLGFASMYDLQAGNQPLKITKLGAYIVSNTNTAINIYYRAGSYIGKETTSSGWVSVYSNTVTTTAGLYVLDVTPFYIPAGQTYGIYVYISKGSATAQNISNVIADANVTVTQGKLMVFAANNTPAFSSGTLNTNYSFYTNIGYQTSVCSPSDYGNAVAQINSNPTLSAATIAPACLGLPLTVSLTGLVPSTTFSVGYSIGGVSEIAVTNVTSDASGNATFSTRNIVSGDNAQTLQITNLLSDAGCSTAFTTNATPSIAVNALPTLSSASLSNACENSTSTLTLNGLLPNSSFTVSYTIDGVAQTDVTGVNSNGSGVANFLTRFLTSADNGKAVVITGLTTTSPASNCPATFSINAGNLVVNTAPTLGAATASITCNGLSSTISLNGLVAGSIHTVNYSLDGIAQLPVTGVVSDVSGNATFQTRVLTTAADDGKALVITGLTFTSPATGCSSGFSVPAGNLSVSNTLPTLTSASLSNVCDGSTATVSLTGLLASTTFTVGYTIDGVSQTSITGVTSDASGNATFSTRAIVLASDDGKPLVITNLTVTGPIATNCPQTFTVPAGNLSVNPVPTLSSATIGGAVCEGLGATINLTGLLPSTTFTVSYSISSVQESDVTNVTADGSGNASFTTRVLSNAADNGTALVITGLTVTATGCTTAFSSNAGNLSVSAPPDALSGGTQGICQTGSYTLVSGDAYSSVGNILWTKSGGLGTLTNTTTLTPTYTAVAGDAGDTILLTMTVSNSPCADATANFTITVSQSPTATINVSGSQNVCPNLSYTLVSGEASASYGSILWTHNGSGTLTNAATLTPIYTASNGDAGNTVTLTMTVTSNNSCNPATATATYDINVNSVSIPVITPGSSTSFCGGDSVTLTASGGIGSYTWNIDQNGSVTTSTSNPITLSHSAGVTVSTSGAGCTATSSTTVVREYAHPTVYITGSNVYCVGASSVLTANAVPGSGSISGYQWQKSTDGGVTWNDISGATNSIYTASGTAADYRVVVTNSNGCSSIACP